MESPMAAMIAALGCLLLIGPHACVSFGGRSDVLSNCSATRRLIRSQLVEIPPVIGDADLLPIDMVYFDMLLVRHIDMQSNLASIMLIMTTIINSNTTWSSSECPADTFTFRVDEISFPRLTLTSSPSFVGSDDSKAYVVKMFKRNSTSFMARRYLSLGPDATNPPEGFNLNYESFLLVRYVNHVEILCDFDSSYYPKDVHECLLPFYFQPAASIAYIASATPRDFLYMKAALNIPKFHYHVVNVSVSPNYNMKTPLPRVILTIERDGKYEMITVLLPLYVISVMPVTAFVLPADSGEKVSVSLTTLLAYFVLSISFFNQMPPSRHIPYVGMIFIYMIIMSLLISIASAFVNRMQHMLVFGLTKSEDEEILVSFRVWLNKYMLYISLFCCIVIPWVSLTKVATTPTQSW